MAAPQHCAPEPTGFSKVPLELLLRMTDDLTTQEIANLRLTCRSIEIALFETFAKEFFSKKQFMLTLPSLTALLDISRSRLGFWLKHVIFGIDFYGPDMIGNAAMTRVSGGSVVASKYNDGRLSQQDLLQSGQAVALLSAVFTELSKHNLHTVGIRDFASALRKNRDGSGARWHSYGAKTVLREFGVDLLNDVRLSRAGSASDMGGTQSDFACQVFRIILQALGTSGTTPAAIEILRTRSRCMDQTAFYISDYLKPTILPVLRRLETLFLPIEWVRGTYALYDQKYIAAPGTTDPNSAVAIACPDYYLRQFLGHLDNVKHLRLNVYRGDPAPFFHWLGETTSPVVPAGLDLPNSPDPACLPSLVELNLGFAKIKPNDLLRILCKFAPTLKRLELWRISLGGSSDAQATDPDNQPSCFWPGFLRKLRAVPGLHLTHLMIGGASQSVPTDYEPVFFKSLVKDAGGLRRSTQQRSFTGRPEDVTEFVKDLEQDMYVNTPVPDDIDSDESEDEGEDEGEGDDSDQEMSDEE